MIINGNSRLFDLPWHYKMEALNSTCHLCGERIGKKTFSRDHILPRARRTHGKPGGLGLLPAHKECNSKRGDAVLTPTQAHRVMYHRLALIAAALAVQ